MITNLDPRPMYCPHMGERLTEAESAQPDHCEEDGYRPRPEFDAGDNPLLIELAERVDVGRDLSTEAAMFLFAMDIAEIKTRATPEQITHARKVLRRILEESQK